jgi:hypothetical protein
MYDAYSEIQIQNGRFKKAAYGRRPEPTALDEIDAEERHRKGLFHRLVKQGVSVEEAKRRCGI